MRGFIAVGAALAAARRSGESDSGRPRGSPLRNLCVTVGFNAPIGGGRAGAEAGPYKKVWICLILHSCILLSAFCIS